MSDATESANSPHRIRERRRAGQLGWGWPLAMAFLRFPLLVVGIGIAYVLYTVAGEDEPLLASLMTAALVTVFVNLTSLFLLSWLARQEGIRLRDLISFERSRLWSDVGWGFVLLIVLNLPFIGTILLTALALRRPGSAEELGAAMADLFGGPLANGNVSVGVPIWVAAATAFLFPLVNPVVEEMHYRGYVQPRLEVLSGSTWAGIGIMAAGFATQHLAYGLTAGGALVYAIAYLVWGCGAGIVYWRQRRLPSLIVAHFVINASFASLPLIFMLTHAGR